MNALGPSKVRTAAKEAWGNVNSVKQVVPGVWVADTWGHGGFLVAVGPNEPFKLDERLRIGKFEGAGWTAFGTPVLTFYQFEQDCDYAVLLLYHPEIREAANRKGIFGPDGLELIDVERVVQSWSPEFLS